MNRVSKKIQIFKQAGPQNVHIIADFDGTISMEYDKHGNKLSSSLSIFRKHPEFMGEKYAREQQKLADYYRPREADKSIDAKTKAKDMEEWFTKTFALLKKYGLCRRVMKRIIKSDYIVLRRGTGVLIETAIKNKIAFTIFSAGHHRVIKGLLRKRMRHVSNKIDLIANYLEFKIGLGGKFTGKLHHRLIHPKNKTVEAQRDRFKKKEVLQRKNIIILGDSLHDLDMAKGLGVKRENIIAIAFCSRANSKESIEQFHKKYDIVLEDIESFYKVVEIVEEIASKRIALL